MIIVTSLSPNHSNAANQQAAIDSWLKYGRCYSINGTQEAFVVSGIYKTIYFKETERTLLPVLNKPLVNINTMFSLADSHDDNLLILNSDILLTSLPTFPHDGITIISRHDYTDDINQSKIFTAGFDAFYIPKQFLSIFPPSIYAMGAAWWDYWIPYRAMMAGVPVYWPIAKHAFHKLHPTQYSQAEWLYIGEYFKWEFKLDRNLHIGQMATKILSKIQQKAIRI